VRAGSTNRTKAKSRAGQLQRALGLLVAVTVAIAIVARLSSGSPKIATIDSRCDATDRGSRPIVTTTEAPMPRDAATLLGTAHRVRVTDTAGRAIATAWLARATRWPCRILPENEPGELPNAGAGSPWHADAGGVVCITMEQLQQIAASYAWVVRAPGYVAQLLAIDQGDETTVRLEEAAVAKVTCVDEAGAPIPGVVVALTQSPDGALATQGILAFQETGHARLDAGASDDLAIWITRTDARGNAEFTDLKIGTYFVEPSCPTHARAEANGRLRVNAPGTCLLVFREVLGAAFRFEPAERMVAWLEVLAPEERSRLHTLAHRAAAASALRIRYPDCFWVTRLASRSGTAELRLAGFVEGHGRWETSVHLQPVNRIDHAEIITLPPRSIANCARLRWLTSPPLDLSAGTPGPRVKLAGGKDHFGFEIVAEYGCAVWVPSCTLEVQAETFALSRAIAIPSELRLEPGEKEIVWQLASTLAPCRFRLLPESGLWGSLDIAIEAAGNTAVWIPGYVLEPRLAWQRSLAQHWLPPGPVALQVSRGHDKLAVRGVLGPEGGMLECDVRELLAQIASRR
jgi:hypothetical protein